MTVPLVEERVQEHEQRVGGPQKQLLGAQRSGEFLERLEQCGGESTSSESLATVYNLSDGEPCRLEGAAANGHAEACGGTGAGEGPLQAQGCQGEGPQPGALDSAREHANGHCNGAEEGEGHAASGPASQGSGSLNPVLVAAVDAVEFKPKPKALNALAADFVPGGGGAAGAPQGDSPYSEGAQNGHAAPTAFCDFGLEGQVLFGDGIGGFSTWGGADFTENGYFTPQHLGGDYGPYATPCSPSAFLQQSPKGARGRPQRGLQGRLGGLQNGHLRLPGLQPHLSAHSSPPPYPPELELEAGAAVLSQQFPELAPHVIHSLLQRERSLPAVLNLLMAGVDASPAGGQPGQRAQQAALPALDSEESFPSLAASCKRASSAGSTPSKSLSAALSNGSGSGSGAGPGRSGRISASAPCTPEDAQKGQGSGSSGRLASPGAEPAAAAGAEWRSTAARGRQGVSEAEALRMALFTPAPLPPEAQVHKSRHEGRPGSGSLGPAPKGPAPPPKDLSPAAKGLITPRKAAPSDSPAASDPSPPGAAQGPGPKSASPGGLVTPPGSAQKGSKGSKRGARLAVPVGQPYCTAGSPQPPQKRAPASPQLPESGDAGLPPLENGHGPEGDPREGEPGVQARRRKRNAFFEQAKRAYLRGDLDLAYELGRLGRCETDSGSTPSPCPSGAQTPLRVVDLLLKPADEALALAKRELASTRSGLSRRSSGSGEPSPGPPTELPQGDPKRLYFACGLGSLLGAKAKVQARVPEALEALFASEGLPVFRPHPCALEVHVL